MSLRNIIFGLICGVCVLVGGFASWWRWSLHPLWLPFGVCIIVLTAFSIAEERRRRAFLQGFWNRACSGIRWKRRFPECPGAQIREFLSIFVDAFAFQQKRRLCFSPDDKVMEIYRGLYPDRHDPDCMELETLVARLRKRYGVDAASFWREDITLGELFTHTRVA